MPDTAAMLEVAATQPGQPEREAWQSVNRRFVEAAMRRLRRLLQARIAWLRRQRGELPEGDGDRIISDLRAD